MKNKKRIASLFAGAWALGAISLMGSASVAMAAEGAEGFEILYPEYMKESQGESLVLEKEPEKIVCLSNSALQILVRCDIKPIAIQNPGTTVAYPDWVSELPVIEAGMSSLDCESIIAMEPDLVIMGAHFEEDYGPILADAGIPVYYTNLGPSTTYSEVKNEALVLGESFGGEEEKAEIEKEFAEVEERAAQYKESHEAKSMMILFSAPPSYQQTSKGYLGSMLEMLSFDNLSDELVGADARTAPLDLEKLVEEDPEVLFAISPTAPTAEMLEAAYQEEFTNNAQIWDNLTAVSEGNIIYLSSDYVTAKGIHVIDSLNELMDMLDEKLQ